MRKGAMALPKLKQLDFAYDRSVIITGNEINEYFKVLLKALSLIQPETAEHSTHIGHGMVHPPQKENVQQNWKSSDRFVAFGHDKGWSFTTSERGRHTQSPEEREQMAELVGQGSDQVLLFKNSQSVVISPLVSMKHLIFSGQFRTHILLYTYVRTHNVLTQAASGKIVV